VTIIEDRLGAEVDSSQLYQTAARELALELDELMGRRGNAVLTREQLTHAEAWRRGIREGIGVEFQLVPGQGLLLQGIIEDSPGHIVGLQAGDLVVGIDGISLLGLEAREVLDCIHAEDPPVRVLDIRRGEELSRVEVPRGSYKVHNMHLFERPGQPAIIELNFFGEGLSEQLQALLVDLEDRERLVLDLRDNQGGMLQEAISCAGFFLEPGAVILQRVSWDGMSQMVGSSAPRVWDGELVLLVNRGTGGPAEAFVAALQAHQEGKVVGTRTAGNAGLPSFHDLGSGLVMQLSDEFMRGPMGGEWSGEGLLPDILVEPVNFMLDPRPGVAPPDLQRDAAIQLISTQ